MYLRDQGGDVVAFALMLMLLLIFLAVRGAIFVTMTFLKYYKKWVLWVALAVCVLLSTCGVLLTIYYQNEAWEALVYAGVGELLIVCRAIDMVNRDTLMVEAPGLTEQVLGRSWWASEDEPGKEQAA